MRIQNMAGAALSYHIGAQSNTSGFLMETEQLLPYFECIEQIKIHFEQL
jgi:hypothetical protein